MKRTRRPISMKRTRRPDRPRAAGAAHFAAGSGPPHDLTERRSRARREDASEEQRLHEPARRRAQAAAVAVVQRDDRRALAGDAEEGAPAAGARGVPVEAGYDDGQAAARAAGLRLRKKPVARSLRWCVCENNEVTSYG